METYRIYPPQTRAKRVPYQLLAAGTANCHHELLDEEWQDRISVQDGIVFITYACRYCGRQVCQSLDEVSPPSWNGISSHQNPVTVKTQPAGNSRRAQRKESRASRGEAFFSLDPLRVLCVLAVN